MTCDLIKRGNLDAEMYTGRMPCDDKDRGWGAMATS